MASALANDIVLQMRIILKEHRLKIIDEFTDAPMSLRQFASQNNIDPSMISRIENTEETRVPAINFWVDLTMALGCSIGDLQREAENRINKSSK